MQTTALQPCVACRPSVPRYVCDWKDNLLKAVPLQAEHALVSEYLANYSRVREILEEISQINQELLRRRQPM